MANQKKFNIFKNSNQGKELLETMKGANFKEVQSLAVIKYMNIVLSTQTQLVIETV